MPLSQWCPSRLKNNTSPPLRKWLKQNFVPHFADVQFGSTNVHVDMKNTTCANITVGHITPTSSSDNATTTRLGIRIDNLATSCSSDVAVHVVLLGDHTGHATVTIAGTSVDVTLELTGEASQLPRHMSLKHCTASVTQIQVVLSGLNLPKAITNDVQKLISNEARKYVHDKLCDYVTPKVASAGEDALARLDAWLKRLANTTQLPPTPTHAPPPPPPFAPGTTWRANPLLISAQAASDAAVADGTLHRSLMSLTRGTGIMNASSHVAAKFHHLLGGYGELAVERIAIRGLDQDIGLRIAPTHAPDADPQGLRARLWLRTLTIDARLLLAATTPPRPTLCEPFDISIRFDHISLSALLHVDADMDVIGSLMPNQYGCLGCVIAAVRNVSLQALDFEHAVPTHIDVYPVLPRDAQRRRRDQGKPLSDDDDDDDDDALEIEIDDLVVNWTSTVLTAYASSASTAVTKVVAAAGRLAVTAAVETQLETIRADAGPCDAPAPLDEYALPRVYTIFLHVAQALYAFAAVALVAWIREEVRKGSDEDDLRNLDAATTLPPLSPCAPASYFFATATAATCALFFASNVAIAAEVKLSVVGRAQNDFAAQNAAFVTTNTTSQPLYGFSLGNTVVEMWQAKVYVLDVLIAVMSGVWPYVKLLGVTVLWFRPSGMRGKPAADDLQDDFTPLRHLLKPSSRDFQDEGTDMGNYLPLLGRSTPTVAQQNAETPWCIRRTRLLYILDVLGKWSLTDIIILVLLTVSFQYTLEGNNSAGEYSKAYIRVYSRASLAYFALATMASLLLANLVVRVDERWWKRIGGRYAGKRARSRVLGALVPSPLRYIARMWQRASVAIAPPLHAEDVSEAPRRGVAIRAAGYALVLYALTFAYALALSVPCVTFTFGGLAGFFAAQSRPAFDVRHYSIFQIVLGIVNQASERTPEESRHHSIPSLVAIVIFAWSICIAPLLRCLVYAVLMTRRALEWKGYEVVLLTFARGIESWCACDVFIASCVVAVAQLPRFVKFVLGDSCNLINPALLSVGAAERDPTNPNYGPTDFMKNDDTCYDGKSTSNHPCQIKTT